MNDKKKESTALTAEQEKAKALAAQYGDYSGHGYENQTMDDVKRPLMQLLQSNSPQVEGGLLEGAKAGMWHNSSTDKLYPDGFDLLICGSRQVYVEWRPRDAGGGFVAVHDPNSKFVLEHKAADPKSLRPRTKEGNELVQTFELVGLIVSEKPYELVIVPLTSTKIRPYREVNTRLSNLELPGGVKPPRYAHPVHFGSEYITDNPQGKFYGAVIKAAPNLLDAMLEPDDPRFQAAHEVWKLAQEQAMVGDYAAASKGDPDDRPGADPF